ncbi:MAG: hypothetical protein SOV26_02170 [Candidatus Onthovivens sp.]|nr:hypothetical protein [Candidatus Onthovivens sp.]
MSKKSKKGVALLASLLTFSAISVSALVSCGDTPITPTEDTVTQITITNKSELTAEWHEREANRQVKISALPETVNVDQLLDDGTLTITSSNPGVVNVLGKYLAPVKEGTATVTIAHGSLTDSVEITISAFQEKKTTTIAEAKTKAANDEVSVKGKILLETSKGFFIGDSTGYIYIFASIPSGLKVGDTGNFTGTLDSYSGILQIGTLTDSEKSSTSLDITPNYAEPDYDALKSKSKYTSDVTPVSVTGVISSVSAGKNYNKYYFAIEGADPTVGLYSGYLRADQDGKFTVGQKFAMTGFLGGVNSGTTTEHSILWNFYPTTMEEEKPPVVNSITLAAEATTIDTFGTTKLTVDVTPAGSVVAKNYEVVEGKDVVAIDGDTVAGLKAGTAKIVAKAGDITSNEVTITVSETKVALKSIADVKTANKGDWVYFGGIYAGQFKGTTDYGAYVGNGSQGMFLHQATPAANSGIAVGDKVAIFGLVDVFNSAIQVKSVKLFAKDETVEASPITHEVVTSFETFDNSRVGDFVKVSGTAKTDIVADKYGNKHFTLVLANKEEIEIRCDSRYTSAATLNYLTDKKAGAALEFTANYTVYNTKKQLQNVVFEGAVEPEPEPEPEPAALTAFPSNLGTLVNDYVFVNDSTSAYTDGSTIDLSNTIAEGSAEVLSSITADSKVYAGYTGYTDFGLKFGTADIAGQITLTFKDTTVTKIAIAFIGWKNSDKITVGSNDAATSSKAYSAVTSSTLDVVSYDIDATSPLTIAINKRGFIQHIAFYK